MQQVMQLQRLFVVAVCSLGTLPATVEAGMITVEFSGVITNKLDLTGQDIIAGAEIVAGQSTFSGSFSYDSTASPSSSGPSFANYVVNDPQSPLSVTIDGTHTFMNQEPDIFLGNDQGSPFFDEITVRDATAHQNVFSIPYNSSDNFFRLTLRDTDQTVFGPAPPLPTLLSLADFETAQIFIRSDFSRDVNNLWTISGEITSLSWGSASAVPEPASLSLFALGAIGMTLAAIRHRRRKESGIGPSGELIID